MPRDLTFDRYHLPAHISQHVDYITPGLKLLTNARVTDGRQVLSPRGFRDSSSGIYNGPIFKGPASGAVPKPNAATNCDSEITPDCISTMYNITQGTLAATGNQLGIFEEGDFLSFTDLSQFLTTFESGRIPSSTKPKIEGVDGGTAPSSQAGPGAESDLDFQISIPIIFPQGTVLFQTDDFPYATGQQAGNNGAFNTFLDAIDGSYCTFDAFGEKGNSPLDPTYVYLRPRVVFNLTISVILILIQMVSREIFNAVSTSPQMLSVSHMVFKKMISLLIIYNVNAPNT